MDALKTIVLASSNSGKLREISALLAPVDIHVASQADYGIPEAEETGLTFVENAIIKARHACAHTGRPAIADDSGLEVNALNGAPGIYSSRYAGPAADDRANLDKLLNAIADIPDGQRSARFQCLMVYLDHECDPTPIICQGTWEGEILREPRGTGGFGYDPIFYVPTHQCASAELAAAVKNRLSHRGQALRQLLEALENA